MKSVDTKYYVLPEGATQEELWSWDAIEDMCRSGEFTPDTRVFLPAKNCWVRAGDSELKPLFKDTVKAAETTPSGEAQERSTLEDEYQEAVRAARESASPAESHVEAGRLAAELGDREAARDHFQRALDLKPFNPRIAREVQRRFSKTECKQFEFLRRDPPAWDDPADIFIYPLAAGVLYLAVPAAVLFALLLVPLGPFLAGPLVFLWGVLIARDTAAGGSQPPLWHAALASPISNVILPLIAGVAVTTECVLVLYGAGRLSMLLGGSGGTAFESVAESPILSVILAVVALAYLPAVFARITHSVGIVVDLLNPWTIGRSINGMGQEYAVSALFVTTIAAVTGGLWFAIGGIPVLGKALLAMVVAYAIPMVAFALGRLAGRMQHVL
jgi:hypothetical protein